jgi:hypothetical protein
MLKKEYIFICFNIFVLVQQFILNIFISQVAFTIQLYLIHYTKVFRTFLYNEIMISRVSSNSIVNITSAYIYVHVASFEIQTMRLMRIHVPWKLLQCQLMILAIKVVM